MSQNIEFKAICRDVLAFLQLLPGLGARFRYTSKQTDTYFAVTGGRLKLREDSNEADALIAYRRADDAALRPSDFDIARVSTPRAGVFLELLAENLRTTTIVRKKRHVYDYDDGVIINVDTLENGRSFVEIEVLTTDGLEAARARALSVANALSIRDIDILPWSYQQLVPMYEWANKCRDAQGDSQTVTLVDGPSGVGKTTLVNRLLSTKRDTRYVPRYTTRAPRPGEEHSAEYHFVSQADFARRVDTGELIEYRHFDFGMSYGMAWADLFAVLRTGANALGVVDLGAGRWIHEFLPSATCVLVLSTAAEVDRRLRARGSHTEEQIQERVSNAEAAEQFAPYYDHVIENHDGRIDQALAELVSVVDGKRPFTPRRRNGSA